MTITLIIKNFVYYIRKSLFYLFGYLLLLISYIFPRRGNVWIFASYMGFEGNAKYLYLFLSENRNIGIKAIWIGNHKQIKLIRSINGDLAAYRRWSLRGIAYSLIGGVYLFNSSVGEINLFTSGRAKMVNLWHGLGIKRIGKCASKNDIIYKNPSFITKMHYLSYYKNIDAFLSTSINMNKCFSESFGIHEEKMVKGMYPRCGVFLKSEQEVLGLMKKYESKDSLEIVRKVGTYSYVYFYMPTFRDTQDDFFEINGFDLTELNKHLVKTNSLFLLKLHSDTVMNKNQGGLSNIQVLDKNLDVYPILRFTNCLITDYSSIYLEYILMSEKDIILYIPDIEKYERVRGFYFPYNEYVEGVKVYDFAELLKVIDRPSDIHCKIDREKIDRIKNFFWDDTLEMNIHGLIASIDSKLNLNNVRK